MKQASHPATALALIATLALLWTPLTTAEEMTKEPEALSLITATPEEGFQVALKLSRLGVTQTQPNREILHEGRKAYAQDPDSLIAASHVVAVHFQTIAAANNYWRDNAGEAACACKADEAGEAE